MARQNRKSTLLMAPRCATLLFAIVLLAACAGTPPEQDTSVQTAARLQEVMSEEKVSDGRGRFREIYCQVLEAGGAGLPDYRPCDEALRRLDPESGGTGEPVQLGQTKANYLVLVVPGLGWNCFENWLDLSNSVPEHAAKFGYEVRVVPVDGLSSTENNARMIRDYVAALPEGDAGRPLILAGYSKGAPDILEAVTRYPELARRVSAVVSLSGAVQGSPLAENSNQGQANMLTLVPGSQCEEEHGDNAAVASLQPETRHQWFEDNTLPAHIHYYSVVTFPEPGRVSWALKKTWLLLGEFDANNDTQVIIYDQLVPGSRLVALVNADHWAMAVPVSRGHPLVAGSLVNHNDYPREAFLEALLRYIEEDLAQPADR